MEQINLLVERYPQLAPCKADISDVCGEIISAYEHGKKLLACGNGGSCADSDHIVGELMKGFCRKRPLPAGLQEKLAQVDGLGTDIAGKLQCTLRAINLCAHAGLATAFCNDVDPDLIYAQQVLGYADSGDIFLGLTTSGNSKNVLCAAVTAKALGAVTVGMTGQRQCKMDGLFDYVIHVPETETYRVQELHLPVYHAICLEVEAHFFKA